MLVYLKFHLRHKRGHSLRLCTVDKHGGLWNSAEVPSRRPKDNIAFHYIPG